MVFPQDKLEQCAKVLSGTLVSISDKIVGISFGVAEEFWLVLGVGDRMDEAAFFRVKEGVGELEFAFRCTSIEIHKNPYGYDNCVVLTDDILKYSPLTIVPMGVDKRHIWMKASIDYSSDLPRSQLENEGTDAGTLEYGKNNSQVNALLNGTWNTHKRTQKPLTGRCNS